MSKKSIRKNKRIFKNFDKNNQLVIVGSNDHTNILIKLFNKEFLKIKNINYFEYKNNDIYENKIKLLSLKA